MRIDQSPVKGHLGTIEKGKLWGCGGALGSTMADAQHQGFRLSDGLELTPSSFQHHPHSITVYPEPRQGFLIWESLGETLDLRAGTGQEAYGGLRGIMLDWTSPELLLAF